MQQCSLIVHDKTVTFRRLMIKNMVEHVEKVHVVLWAYNTANIIPSFTSIIRLELLPRKLVKQFPLSTIKCNNRLM